MIRISKAKWEVKNAHDGMQTVWEDLANNIILQALRDFREAGRKLKKNPDNEQAWNMIDDVEGFLRSRWFSQISDLDGKTILRGMRKEASL